MYYIRQNIIHPITDQYNRYIDGFYLANLLEVKGGATAGNDYISKVFRSKYHDIQNKYDSAVESVRNPQYTTFLQDNLLRLFGFNAVQRLITAYQAYPVLKASLAFPGTLSHTFTQITNEGLFSGMLKGSLLAAIQFSCVLYPSVYIANKSENKYVSFLTTYTLFDAILYPVDFLKNILYSETHSNLNLRKASELITLRTIVNEGFLYKLAFNIPYLTSMYLTTQSDNSTATTLSWLFTAALYPLNTLKVQSQLLKTDFALSENKLSLSKSALYRGVVPFILLNSAFGWALRPLFSSQKLASIESAVRGQKLAVIGRQ